MPNGSLNLDADILFIVFYVKPGLRGIRYPPNHYPSDFNGISQSIIHFEYLGYQVTGPQRNLCPATKRVAPAKPGVTHRALIRSEKQEKGGLIWLKDKQSLRQNYCQYQ